MATRMSRNILRIESRQTVCSLASGIQVQQYSSKPRIIKNPTTASLKRGTGGRSSFNGIVCTVFGNTGFLGRYLCNRLGKIGTQLILPYRGDHYDSMRLKLCGDLGQVLFHPFHLQDEESILKCIKYSNVVINLIGREYETKNFTYDDVNVEGARRLARLCKQANVERFIHVSCLNASPNPQPLMLKEGSRFLRSKWEGECAVKEEFPEATIVRPSDIYGQEDRFLRVYTSIWRHHLKGVPLWRKGEETEKQPVFVSDVAAGLTALTVDPQTAGKTYQFVGPKRYKLSELVDWLIRLIRHNPEEYGYRRWPLEYMLLFQMRVSAIEILSPGNPARNIHWEGLEKEHMSDTILKNLPTLEDLGVALTEIETQAPWEVSPYHEDRYYMRAVGEFDPPAPPKSIPLN